VRRLIAIPAVLLLAAAVIVAAFGAVVGARPAAKTAPKATVIKIGHIVDQTGPMAQIGGLFAKTLTAANKQWPTIAGKSVQVITADGLGTPTGALDAARKLVTSDHVVAIIGPTQGNQKVAVANYVKRAHVPLILYNPSPQNVYKDNPWVIAAGGSSTEEPTVIADYLLKNLGWKSLSAIFVDGSDQRSFEDPALTYFRKHGGKVVQASYTQSGNPDFGPVFTTLKSSNGILAWQDGSNAFAFWNAYVQSGTSNKMKVAAVFTGAMCDAFIVNNLPSAVQAAVNGTPGPTMYAPDHTSAANTLFIKVMTPVLGYPPDQTASGSWQGYMVFKAGLEKAKGNTSAKKLIAGILAAKTDGPEGLLTFAKGQHVAGRNVYIVKVAPIPGVSGKYAYKTVKTYKNVSPAGWK
jgi:branched-chain amino acid transport system substrate-binding protein